jgi:hypothetical protein
MAICPFTLVILMVVVNFQSKFSWKKTNIMKVEVERYCATGKALAGSEEGSTTRRREKKSDLLNNIAAASSNVSFAPTILLGHFIRFYKVLYYFK